jgi:polyferredoxin
VFVEERFGVYFLRYCGRSIDGSGRDRRAGTHRCADCIRACLHIAAATVEPAIKRRSQAKLAASLLLPDALYVTLRAEGETLRLAVAAVSAQNHRSTGIRRRTCE